jgi:hypothetical protein
MDEGLLIRTAESGLLDAGEQFVKIYRLHWLGGCSVTVSKPGEKTYSWTDAQALQSGRIYMVEMVGKVVSQLVV